MAETQPPLEGKIVVLQFIEQDYSGEASTLVVYQVVNNQLKPVRGVDNLPDQVEDWQDEDGKAIEAIRALGVSEVYTPIYTPVFFEFRIGVCQESVISHINERGELENWFQFDTISDGEWLRGELAQYQIKLRYFNSEKNEIIPDDET